MVVNVRVDSGSKLLGVVQRKSVLVARRVGNIWLERKNVGAQGRVRMMLFLCDWV